MCATGVVRRNFIRPVPTVEDQRPLRIPTSGALTTVNLTAAGAGTTDFFRIEIVIVYLRFVDENKKKKTARQVLDVLSCRHARRDQLRRYRRHVRFKSDENLNRKYWII